MDVCDSTKEEAEEWFKKKRKAIAQLNHERQRMKYLLIMITIVLALWVWIIVMCEGEKDKQTFIRQNNRLDSEINELQGHLEKLAHAYQNLQYQTDILTERTK